MKREKSGVAFGYQCFFPTSIEKNSPYGGQPCLSSDHGAKRHWPGLTRFISTVSGHLGALIIDTPLAQAQAVDFHRRELRKLQKYPYFLEGYSNLAILSFPACFIVASILFWAIRPTCPEIAEPSVGKSSILEKWLTIRI
ncbi:MAG: hypothetical protein DRN21_02510 [Thermoplasmata archaeon]|nr:MAG: hypothetical protein DRQ24_09145 [Candidatus Latescibacterota bacterium]RLF40225.1 MAG: hypothetical protein DRN21_02510 [Thermoplasmata archaeon]